MALNQVEVSYPSVAGVFSELIQIRLLRWPHTAAPPSNLPLAYILTAYYRQCNTCGSSLCCSCAVNMCMAVPWLFYASMFACNCSKPYMVDKVAARLSHHLGLVWRIYAPTQSWNATLMARAHTTRKRSTSGCVFSMKMMRSPHRPLRRNCLTSR